jgi:ketosteroid isomerase-like protein
VSGRNARVVLDALEQDSTQPMDVEEVHEDGESVVVIGRRAATVFAGRWIVRDGEIVESHGHADPDEALRLAGFADSTARDVALVRRHYDAFNRADVDAIAATLDPGIKILGTDERGAGTLELYSGIDQARAFFAEIKEEVADNHATVLSLDARPGRVEASVRLSGTIRATERSGSLPAIHIFAISDGLIAQIETYRPDWRAAVS